MRTFHDGYFGRIASLVAITFIALIITFYSPIANSNTEFKIAQISLSDEDRRIIDPSLNSSIPSETKVMGDDNISSELAGSSSPISFNTAEDYNVNFDVRDLSNKILPTNTVNMLSSLAPDNYINMQSPNDSSLFGRYSSTYYGDDMKINVGVKASNVILDTFFQTLTDNIFSLNIVYGDQLNANFQGMKLFVRPLYWLRFNVTFGITKESARSSNFEMELSPFENSAFVLKTRDNETETRTGLEFLMKF